MTKEENIKKRKMLKDKIKEVVKRSKTLDYKIGDLHLLADLRGELKFLQSQLMLLEFKEQGNVKNVEQLNDSNSPIIQ